MFIFRNDTVRYKCKRDTLRSSKEYFFLVQIRYLMTLGTALRREQEQERRKMGIWKERNKENTSQTYYPTSLAHTFQKIPNKQTKKLTNWLIYQPSSCSRVLPETLTSPQLLKKFPEFYATQRFITALTRARYLSLSGTRSSPWSTSRFFKI
jgi:hypothetical protein